MEKAFNNLKSTHTDGSFLLKGIKVKQRTPNMTLLSHHLYVTDRRGVNGSGRRSDRIAQLVFRTTL